MSGRIHLKYASCARESTLHVYRFGFGARESDSDGPGALCHILIALNAHASRGVGAHHHIAAAHIHRYIRAAKIEVATIEGGFERVGETFTTNSLRTIAAHRCRDRTAVEIAHPRRLDALAQIAAHRHIHISTGDGKHRVGFQTGYIFGIHGDIHLTALDIDATIIVGIDAITLHTGHGHRAATHRKMIVFHIAHISFTAVNTIAHRAQNIDITGGFLQLQVFLGSDSVLGVARHIQRAATFKFRVSAKVECRLLRASRAIGESIDGALIKHHRQSFTIIDAHSRPGRVGDVHAIEHQSGFIGARVGKRAIVSATAQRVGVFRSHRFVLCDIHVRTDDGRRDVCGNVATHPSHSSGIIVSHHHLIVGHRGRVHRNAIDIRNAKSFVLRRKSRGIAKGHHAHLLVAESPLSGAGVHPERLCLRRRRRIAPTKAATFENNISDGSHIAHIDFAIFIHIANFQIAFSGKH